MKNLVLFGIITLSISTFLYSCSENKKNGESAEIANTDIVPSGIYTGIAKEVDPDELEIYVQTADGKILELYLTDETKITKKGTPANFSDLKQKGQVEVTVEKIGKKLDPKVINILE